MSNANKARFTYCDDDVYDRVRNFLQSRHFPAFRQLVVQVEEGAVTLSGNVCSYYEKQVALTSCQHVAGVLSLVDCVVVTGAEWEESRYESRVVQVTD